MQAELGETPRTTIPPLGMLPISVRPQSTVWFELHAKFGKLPLTQVLAPAIRYAEEGFPVQRAHRVLLGPQRRDSARATSARRVPRTYAPNGQAPGKGEIFKNPSLAAPIA